MKQQSGSRSGLPVLFSVATFILIVTFSIGLPIYCRPFYYMHIEWLQLERSGYTAAQIREAYNEILDYLTLPGGSFHAGDFPFTESGAAHFTDCKVLFTLNAALFLLSAIVVIGLLLLKKQDRIPTLHIGRFHACFYAAVAALLLIAGITVLASMDFYAAFVTFHSIFFPGKENWILNYKTDPIINVMPQDFFMHCAMLIGASIVLISFCIIIAQLRHDRKSCERQ